MKQTTLICSVGRAAPRGVLSVNHDAADHDAQLAAAEVSYRSALIAGGTPPARIVFERDTVEIEDESTPKPKKGKG